MLMATVDSTSYKIVLILHIVFVLSGFGGLFLAPLLTRETGVGGARAMVGYIQRIALPSVLLAGILGIGMVSMSDKHWTFKQGWVSAAMAVWLVQMALYFFLLLPAQRKLAGGDESMAKKLPMFAGLLHLSIVVMVYLMVFKPGA